MEHFHDLCEDCFVKAGGTAAEVPQCNDCSYPLFFSTEERYRASAGTGEYNCDDCKISFACLKGYYRCANHSNDFCESCYVKRGGQAREKIPPKCNDCSKPLVYSTDARYLSSHNSPAFSCSRCHENKICT